MCSGYEWHVGVLQTICPNGEFPPRNCSVTNNAFQRRFGLETNRNEEETPRSCEMLSRIMQRSTQRPSTLGIINSIWSQVLPRKRLFGWALYLVKYDSSEPIPVIHCNPEKKLMIIFYVVLEYPVLHRASSWKYSGTVSVESRFQLFPAIPIRQHWVWIDELYSSTRSILQLGSQSHRFETRHKLIVSICAVQVWSMILVQS
jgi:hypothetical protein